MSVIPFYGADDPAMFAIERRAMDRDGLVIAALDRALPSGDVLDVGAGDGFTARRLATGRRLTGLEPAAAMVRPGGGVRWVLGEAEHLPFADATFDAAYATWAYFFSRDWDPTPGIAELDRVVRPGGALAIAENLGGDAFGALAVDDLSADPDVLAWRRGSDASRSRRPSGSTISRRRGACSASSSGNAAATAPRRRLFSASGCSRAASREV